MSAAAGTAWTKPYYGVQHLGQMKDRRWATVCDRGAFAELTRWHHLLAEGDEEIFPTAEQARTAGERYVAGTCP